MNLLPTFPLGGLSCEEDISSLGQELKNARVPHEVLIPLRFSPCQEGKEIILHVSEGMIVEEDQLLSTPKSTGGLPIYSSIPGRIEKIVRATFPFVGNTEAAHIRFSGSFKRQRQEKVLYNWRDLSQIEILKQLARLGASWENSLSLIQYLKKHLNENLEYLILSLIEDNPYTNGKVAFFQKLEKEMLEGLSILINVLKPTKGVIIAVNDLLLKKNLEELAFIKEYNVKVARLARRYPQSNAKLLINTLLGIPFSQIKHPLSHGILIANPYQIYHTRQAIYERQPKTEQILNLSGGALKGNYLLKVRIGTSLSQILEQDELLKEKPYKAVLNNPFWGKEIYDFNQPVTHQINSISFLTKRECQERAHSPCLNCGLCAQICPVGLEPISIYKAIQNGTLEEAIKLGIKDCIECGLCSYSCPSKIALAETIIKTKKGLDCEK